MKLIAYGSQQEYEEVQILTNRRKLDKVFAQQEEVDSVIGYFKNRRGPKFGICHGARNGWEVEQFRKGMPTASVIGTDISLTANNFPHMVQWDFHNPKIDWLGKADFIYSNSLDHSYCPRLALFVWFLTLNRGGVLFLSHHRRYHSARHASQTDPFGGSLQEYVKLIEEHGKVVGEIILGKRCVLVAEMKHEHS